MAKNKRKAKVEETVVETVAAVEPVEVLETIAEKEEKMPESVENVELNTEGVNTKSETDEQQSVPVEETVVEEVPEKVEEVTKEDKAKNAQEAKRIMTTKEMFGYNWMGQIYSE